MHPVNCSQAPEIVEAGIRAIGEELRRCYGG